MANKRRSSITITPTNASNSKTKLGFFGEIEKETELKRTTTIVTGSKRGAFTALEID
jgi:hypothetical protein